MSEFGIPVGKEVPIINKIKTISKTGNISLINSRHFLQEFFNNTIKKEGGGRHN